MVRWLAVPVVTFGALVALPGTAGATVEAPNPNFDGYCEPTAGTDGSEGTCSLMQPQGNSDTVWGELSYSIDGDTITFVVTPNPTSARITEAQYCDSSTPYEEITAGLCAGKDRQLSDDGPPSQGIALTLDAEDGTYTGTATYNEDEPYWTVHYVVNGETVYSVGNTPPCSEGETVGDDGCETSEPAAPECDEGMIGGDTNENGVIDDGECTEPAAPECDEGMIGGDTNENGVIDDGECTEPAAPECPEGMTGGDTNENGVIDDGECTEPEEEVVDTTCPDGSAMTDKDGNGVVNEADCNVTTNTVTDTNTNTNTDTNTNTESAATVLSAGVERPIVPTVAPAGAPAAAPANVASAAVASAAAVAPAALAATGADSDLVAEAAFGLLMVALGAAMLRVSRRKEAVA